MSEFNYITTVGLAKIRTELDWLQKTERPTIVKEVTYAASLGDRSENAEYIYGKKRLREIDRRMRFLMGRLSRIRVVNPAELSGEKVLFGATVVIADEDGEEATWRIYGEDEVDVDNGVLSWRSPLARALLGKSQGEAVTFHTPGGPREIELLSVRYDAQDHEAESRV